ncbi:MAG: DnaD domain protein [Anaerolineaceae bacterium]
MSSPAFKGFPAQSRLVRIPEPFFLEILPSIDDIHELKVTLYTLWYLERLEQPVKYIKKRDYLHNKIFMHSLGGDEEENLTVGLDKATARGTLLKAEVSFSDKQELIYLANTPRSRAVVNAIHSGNFLLDQLTNPTGQMDILRPNIFELYEQNIGIITPMLAEILKDAESIYPAAWIEEAIGLAVQNNSRRWRYIEAILRKWKENGRDGEY